MIETSQFLPLAGQIDLGIGQPQLSLLPNDALARAAATVLDGRDNACLNYGPARGNGYLLLALAEFLTRRYGHRTEPAELMATGGCSQALAMIAATFARPGDTVLVEDPTYFLAPRIFTDAGLNVVGVPLGERGLQPEVLEQAVKEHRPTLLYTIPIHQNPTGATLAAESRAAVVEICRRHGVLLIADEVYQLLNYEGDPPPPLAVFASSGTVISVGSFSKILSPGLRLGWIQTAPSLIARLTSLGTFASGGGINHLTGCLVHSVLASGDQDRYLDSLLDTFRARVKLMDGLLGQIPRISYQKPNGGYFFWLRLGDGLDAQTLLQRASAHQVGYRAGILFSPSGQFRDYLRLSFAHYGNEDLQEGVQRLGRLLGQTG